ncbi:MAG: ribonuclease P protein component [Cyclobacteriaceae bacterium]|nr:ribonuclease P protein component [Cyclobacteriaceae bacterium]
MGLNTFKKSERLCSKKLIKELFDKGSSFYIYPFKVFYNPNKRLDELHQVLFSVPKRNFKKAVDRNLIKRRMREAYRLNKQTINNSKPKLIAYIYTPKEILDYHQIEKKLKISLERLLEKDISI